jgi:hypothetical protein
MAPDLVRSLAVFLVEPHVPDARKAGGVRPLAVVQRPHFVIPAKAGTQTGVTCGETP